MTQESPDWILLAIAEAKWVCLKPDRPRVWCLGVDYAIITEDLQVIPRVIAWRVNENHPDASDTLRANVFVRFQQSRQAMYNAATEMLQSGRTPDGIRIAKIVDPAVAVPYANAQRKSVHGRLEFEKTVDVVGDLAHPNRWGLRHIPTGTTIYFNIWKPLNQMSPVERQHMVEAAMSDLDLAIERAAGKRSVSPDPRPPAEGVH